MALWHCWQSFPITVCWREGWDCACAGGQAGFTNAKKSPSRAATISRQGIRSRTDGGVLLSLWSDKAATSCLGHCSFGWKSV